VLVSPPFLSTYTWRKPNTIKMRQDAPSTAKTQRPSFAVQASEVTSRPVATSSRHLPFSTMVVRDVLCSSHRCITPLHHTAASHLDALAICQLGIEARYAGDNKALRSLKQSRRNRGRFQLVRGFDGDPTIWNNLWRWQWQCGRESWGNLGPSVNVNFHLNLNATQHLSRCHRCH
jgi:hypothetical protein